MKEQIITGKKFRILTDITSRIWHVISFWTKAQDVEFNSGNNAQTTLGNIAGISDSLTSTSSNVAASAKAVKVLNDKIVNQIGNLNKQISDLNGQITKKDQTITDLQDQVNEFNSGLKAQLSGLNNAEALNFGVWGARQKGGVNPILLHDVPAGKTVAVWIESDCNSGDTGDAYVLANGARVSGSSWKAIDYIWYLVRNGASSPGEFFTFTMPSTGDVQLIFTGNTPTNNNRLQAYIAASFDNPSDAKALSIYARRMSGSNYNGIHNMLYNVPAGKTIAVWGSIKGNTSGLYITVNGTRVSGNLKLWNDYVTYITGQNNFYTFTMPSLGVVGIDVDNAIEGDNEPLNLAAIILN